MKVRRSFLTTLVITLSLFCIFVFPTLAQTVMPRPLPAVAGFTCLSAAGAANTTTLTITALDANRQPVPFAAFNLWFSDQPTGRTITATTSSGALTMASAQEVNLVAVAAKNSLSAVEVLTGAAGTAVFSLIDTAKTAFYPVVYAKSTRILVVCTRLTTASYGYNLIPDEVQRFITQDYDSRKKVIL